MKSARGFSNVILVIVVVAIAAIAGGYYFLNQKSTDVPSTSTVPVMTVSEKVVSDFFEEAAELISIENQVFLNENKECSVWWVTSDNYNINVDTIDCIEMTMDQNSAGTKNGIAEIVQIPQIEEFRKIAISVLENNSFIKNENNSSKSNEDDQFYDHVDAFEKGNIKCTITISPDITGIYPSYDDTYVYTSTFACTDNYAKTYEWQYPILTSIGLRNEAISSISRHVGDFYALAIRGRRTGYVMFVKREGDQYREIFSGQAAADCALMDKHGVPKEIYGKCFDQYGELR